MAGTVSDPAWRALAGATIEVVGGPQAGLTTTTDAQGDFQITGAFDETSRFRATKDGHASAERPLPARCEPCNPNWWLHFYLEALAPRRSIAGDYTLTIVTNSACGGLPDDVRARSYEGTVAPYADSTNSRFQVTVEGPRIVQDFNRFVIGVAGEYLAADFGDWGHGGAGLVEQVAANTYVTVSGSFTGSTAEPTISGAFYGIVERCQLQTDWSGLSSCAAGGPLVHEKCGPLPHQLMLTPR
ncbi:MAG TPA: carboxypeptidase-like regulatory domain-containing protein [Vicinamibacterales bacterium]|nr:carboxypeptidase-like regulatory domain-containing protein [Vicinamibacterales bacterium]